MLGSFPPVFPGFSPSIKIPVGPSPFRLPGAAGFVNATFLRDDYLLKQESRKLGPYQQELQAAPAKRRNADYGMPLVGLRTRCSLQTSGPPQLWLPPTTRLHLDIIRLARLHPSFPRFSLRDIKPLCSLSTLKANLFAGGFEKVPSVRYQTREH